jgi:lipase
MQMHAHRWGPPGGAPILCLHGVMGHGGRFRRLAQTFLPQRHIVALDLRGHGRSGWEPPWDIATHVADLVETMDAQGLDDADVMGFSFGGRLALELAAAHPDRVRRIALLDPAVQLPPDVALRLAEQTRADQAFVDIDEAVTARMATLAHTPREMVDEDVAEALDVGDDGMLRYRVSRSAVVAAYGEMARVPNLPSTHLTLLVRAAAGVVDDAQQQLLESALGARLTVLDVPGNHPVMWDAFAETGAAVASHFAQG